jgi:DNA-binding beta-propeller fold protein YncE
VNLNSGNVTVINGTDNSTVTVPSGVTPNSLSVDQFRNVIYVSNGNGNCITKIDGKTNQFITTGNIGNGVNDGALDPLSNRLYLTKQLAGASEVAASAAAPE